jgi:hypothetical protein
MYASWLQDVFGVGCQQNEHFLHKHKIIQKNAEPVRKEEYVLVAIATPP